MLRSLLVAVIVLWVAACASEPRRHVVRRGPGGPPPGARQARMRLFISPSGEPFRGDDGLGAWFARADADHDGTISFQEFQADADRFFHVLDANCDGIIDGLEIRAYEEQMVPEIAANDFDNLPGQEGAQAPGGGWHSGGMGGGRRGGGMDRRGEAKGRAMGLGDGTRLRGAGREGAARYSLINEPEPVANADENLDGKVTLAEWRHASERRFAVLDRARTGRLALDTLQGKAPAPTSSSPTR